MSIHDRFIDPLDHPEIELEEEETPEQVTERRRQGILAARRLAARYQARKARTGPVPVELPTLRPSFTPWIIAAVVWLTILALALLTPPPLPVAGGW